MEHSGRIVCMLLKFAYNDQLHSFNVIAMAYSNGIRSSAALNAHYIL